MGWQKQILRVNLTKGTAEIEPLNMEWANDYLGERGLATKYLYEGMDPKTDPMASQVILSGLCISPTLHSSPSPSALARM